MEVTFYRPPLDGENSAIPLRHDIPVDLNLPHVIGRPDLGISNQGTGKVKGMPWRYCFRAES